MGDITQLDFFLKDEDRVRILRIKLQEARNHEREVNRRFTLVLQEWIKVLKWITDAEREIRAYEERVA